MGLLSLRNVICWTLFEFLTSGSPLEYVVHACLVHAPYGDQAGDPEVDGKRKDKPAWWNRLAEVSLSVTRN